MSTPSYDVIVIGAGPAGLVTATEVARTGLKTLCIDKLAPGGQLINLTELHEFEEPWGGPDMASRLTDEAAVAGVEMGFGDVSKISAGDPCTVETLEGESHTARLLVVATLLAAIPGILLCLAACRMFVDAGVVAIELEIEQHRDPVEVENVDHAAKLIRA